MNFANCGGVHAAVPLADAEPQVASEDKYYESESRPQKASMDYCLCFRRCAPTTGFLPAGLGNVARACTVQGVAVPGVKTTEAQSMERWKTRLAVAAGVAGAAGFLIAMAVLIFAR